MVRPRERAPLAFLRPDDDLGSGDKSALELLRLRGFRWRVLPRSIDTMAGGVALARASEVRPGLSTQTTEYPRYPVFALRAV